MTKNIPYMIVIFLGTGIFLVYNGMNILGYIMVVMGLAGIPIAIRAYKQSAKDNDDNPS